MLLEERRVILVRRVMLWAALIGLFASTYLLITYLTHAPIVCGVVQGCDIVRNSRWATSFGVPRPFLGVIFYGAIIALLVWRAVFPHKRRRFAYHLSMAAVTIGFIESAFLTFVQWIDIKAFCIWCLASATMATILFVLAWWDKPEAFEERTAFRELKFQFFSLTAAVAVGGILILWLTVPRSDGRLPKIAPQIISPTQEEQTRSLLYRPGMTYAEPVPSVAEGLGTGSAEGAATATVVLIEFVDYQCSACKAAHSEVKKVLDRFRGRIRFAIRNFPLPTHSDSAGAALGVICADRQERLFDYGDVLIANQQALKPADLVRYADSLKLNVAAFKTCLAASSTRAILDTDLQNGRALGVRATPTFFVGTTLVEGLPSAEQLGQLIEQAL